MYKNGIEKVSFNMFLSNFSHLIVLEKTRMLRESRNERMFLDTISLVPLKSGIHALT